MYRSVLFLLLIAAAALGAAWVADQTGNVILTWDGWRIETSLPVFALAVGVTIVAAMLMWSILRGLWRSFTHGRPAYKCRGPIGPMPTLPRRSPAISPVALIA